MMTTHLIDWNELIKTSEYETLVAIRAAVCEGDLDEALIGLEGLMEAVAADLRRAMRSHLRQLMAHILKWKIQPDRRSRSWATTILNARDEIDEIQESKPSITDDDIRDVWDEVFAKARRLAEASTGLNVTVPRLTWQEVFDDEYFLSEQ